jgi:hypothetical protein
MKAQTARPEVMRSWDLEAALAAVPPGPANAEGSPVSRPVQRLRPTSATGGARFRCEIGPRNRLSGLMGGV